MREKKICFVSISFPPEFLGGTNLVNKNLIDYINSKKENLSLSWVYFGKQNKKYLKGNVEYIELKSPLFSSPFSFKKNMALVKFFRKNYFDIISARTGIWLHFYKKWGKQEIIQTYHGTRYYFNKNHYERLNIIQKGLLLILLGISWLVDIPGKDVKKVICVSEKVKKQIQKLYGKNKKIVVIRTGVDLTNFRPRNKDETRKKLNFEKEKIYGLYVGRGGYWTKGLDRAINISKEIYKQNKAYRLIVVGPDSKKVKQFLNEKFVIYIKEVKREEMPFYYNMTDLFFCMSRYEGGAPTLVVSEAMASGCLVVCSKSSEQEIIEDEKNGLILESFGQKAATKIMNVLKNENKKNKIIKNSIKTIKEISLEKWGKRYFGELTK